MVVPPWTISSERKGQAPRGPGRIWSRHNLSTAKWFALEWPLCLQRITPGVEAECLRSNSATCQFLHGGTLPGACPSSAAEAGAPDESEASRTTVATDRLVGDDRGAGKLERSRAVEDPTPSPLEPAEPLPPKTTMAKPPMVRKPLVPMACLSWIDELGTAISIHHPWLAGALRGVLFIDLGCVYQD
jgi:hypothetical protein